MGLGRSQLVHRRVAQDWKYGLWSHKCLIAQVSARTKSHTLSLIVKTYKSKTLARIFLEFRSKLKCTKISRFRFRSLYWYWQLKWCCFEYVFSILKLMPRHNMCTEIYSNLNEYFYKLFIKVIYHLNHWHFTKYLCW